MTKRRVKGEGSVYQRKNGRFVGEYDDINGKRRYVSGKNKAEVRAELREKLAERDRGIVVDSEGLTAEKYMDRWLESTRDNVGLRTYQRSEETTRLHIKPTLGRVRPGRLTAMQLDTLYGEKLKSGLSPRTVQIIHATAHKALKQAVRWRMVGMNVAEHATPPRSTGQENAAAKQRLDSTSPEDGTEDATQAVCALHSGSDHWCEVGRNTGLATRRCRLERGYVIHNQGRP